MNLLLLNRLITGFKFSGHNYVCISKSLLIFPEEKFHDVPQALPRGEQSTEGSLEEGGGVRYISYDPNSKYLLNKT